jgi:hypothetical protein
MSRAVLALDAMPLLAATRAGAEYRQYKVLLRRIFVPIVFMVNP